MEEAGWRRWRAGGEEKRREEKRREEKRREEKRGKDIILPLPHVHLFLCWSAQVFTMFTCSEILDLLVFSLTLARAPLSPVDLSVISRAALSSLGVSVLTGAGGT